MLITARPQRHVTCSCKYAQAHTLSSVASRLPFPPKKGGIRRADTSLHFLSLYQNKRRRLPGRRKNESTMALSPSKGFRWSPSGRVLRVDALKIEQSRILQKVVVRDRLLRAKRHNVRYALVGKAKAVRILLNIRYFCSKKNIYRFGRPGSCAGIGAVFFCTPSVRPRTSNCRPQGGHPCIERMRDVNIPRPLQRCFKTQKSPRGSCTPTGLKPS